MGEIDRAALEQIRMLERSKGADMLGKIAGTFLAESPRLVQKIQDAIVKADATALRQSAHYLRSGALGIGASRIADICWQIEHAAEKQLDDATLKKLFVELRVRWQAAADELGSEVFQ